MQLNGVEYSELIRSINGNFSFFTDEYNTNNCYLRHDIDQSIDSAVSMSEIEFTLGIKSTFFLLNTADYFFRHDSIPKYKLIQSLGHQLGYHNNAITQWLKSDGESIHDIIEIPIWHLRTSGLIIRGSASHGDPLCYEKHFINYEVWKEFEKKNNLYYEQVSMKDFSLEYEVYQPQFNNGWYLSDSGGVFTSIDQQFKRTPVDPFEYVEKWNREGKDSLQILIHPQHWT